MLPPQSDQDNITGIIIQAIRSRKLSGLYLLYNKYGASLLNEIQKWVPSNEALIPIYVCSVLNVWYSKEIYTRGKKRFYPWLVSMCQEVAEGFIIPANSTTAKEGLVARYHKNSNVHQYGSPNKPFGRLIRAVRKSLNVSIISLAVLLECDPEEISELESRIYISWELVADIAKVLGVSLLSILNSPGDEWIGDQYNPIGKKIILVRERLSVSKNDLSGRLNIRVSQLSRLEGVSEIRLKKLEQIAMALNVPILEIIAEKPEGGNNEEEEHLGDKNNPMGIKIKLCLNILGKTEQEITQILHCSKVDLHKLFREAAINRKTVNLISTILKLPAQFLIDLSLPAPAILKKHYCDYLTPVGKKIQHARIKQDISVASLAQTMQVEVSFIEGIENSWTITGKMLEKVAAAMRLKIENILEVLSNNLEIPAGPKKEAVRLRQNTTQILSYEKSVEFVITHLIPIGIDTYDKYLCLENKPDFLPADPQGYYGKRGEWISSIHFMGRKTRKPSEVMPYNQARQWVAENLPQINGVKSWRDWLKGAFPALPARPTTLPAVPDVTYKKMKVWKGWPHFLPSKKRI